MDPINFFTDPKYLEPKCPRCKSVMDYGVTTRFDEKENSHVCKCCGCVIE